MIKFIQTTFNQSDYSLEDIFLLCQQYHCIDNPYIVVENDFVAQILENNIASSAGVASYRFYTSINQLINQIYLDKYPDAVIFNLGDLQYIIYNYFLNLHHVFFKDNIADVAEYITDKNGNVDLSLLFKFSQQLQGVFIDYIYYRTNDLIQLDSLNITNSIFPKWQIDLWFYIKKYIGSKLLFTEIYKDFMVSAYSIKNGIYIYNINSIYPSHLSILNKLSDNCSIYWLYLSVSDFYYGDIVPFAVQKNIITRESAVNSLDDLYIDYINPLVSNLAIQSREFVELLTNNNISINILNNILPNEIRNQELLILEDMTILKTLQRDIAELTYRTDDDKRISNNNLQYSQQPLLDIVLQGNNGDYYDHIDSAGNYALSVQFNQCSTKLQEIEVVANKILYLINTDKSLKLSDFIIIAPNIDEYAAYIDMVFNLRCIGTNIPYNLETTSMLFSNNLNVLNFFKEILSLPYQLTASTVLNILKHEIVMKYLDLSYDNILEIESWIFYNNTFFEKIYSEDDPDYSRYNIFQHLKQKLTLGLCIASKNIDDRLKNIVSYDIELSAELLYKFINFLDTLLWVIECIYENDTQYKEFNSTFQAIDLIKKIVNNITGDNIIINEVIKKLFNTYIEKLNVVVLREIIADQNQGQNLYLSGAVTCISLNNFSSCKSKVVFLLGINEGKCPSIEPKNILSILSNTWKLSDRNKNIDDKYHFLNAILLSQKYLILSFIEDNDGSMPSVLLDLLIDVIASTFNLFNIDNSKDIRNLLRIYNNEEYHLEYITTYQCNNMNIIDLTSTNCLELEQQQVLIDINQISSLFLYTNTNFYKSFGLGSFITINHEVRDDEYLDFDNRVLHKDVARHLDMHTKYSSEQELYNYCVKSGVLNSDELMSDIQFKAVLEGYLPNIEYNAQLQISYVYKDISFYIDEQIVLDNQILDNNRKVIVTSNSVYKSLVIAIITASIIANGGNVIDILTKNTVTNIEYIEIKHDNEVLFSLKIDSYKGILDIILEYYLYSLKNPILVHKKIIADTLIHMYHYHHSDLPKTGIQDWGYIKSYITSGYKLWDKSLEEVCQEQISSLYKASLNSNFQDYDHSNNKADGVFAEIVDKYIDYVEKNNLHNSLLEIVKIFMFV